MRDPAREPYDRTYKTAALRTAAERLGLEWFLPRLAVAFTANGEPRLAEPILDEPPNLGEDRGQYPIQVFPRKPPPAGQGHLMCVEPVHPLERLRRPRHRDDG